jgi:Arm DNA-binding domain
MRRVTHRLTAVTVENLKTKGLHPDGDGLYLRITASGSKSWMFRYWRDGRNRDMGLGPVTSISLAKARQLAADVRRLRLDGADPIKARRRKRAAQQKARTRHHDVQGLRRAAHGLTRGRMAQSQAPPAMAQHAQGLRLPRDR